LGEIAPTTWGPAPRLGTAIVWDNIPQCISWPRPAVNPPHRLQIHGAPPILLVAGLHDPNDPYAWALSVAGQIPRSVLLTSLRDGHVAYFRSPCVQTYVDRYLVTRVLGPKRFCP
jgi:TAP-like protein